jgi:hypothetical protein
MESKGASTHAPFPPSLPPLSMQMACMALFTLFALACLCVLLYKLVLRWQYDRKLLKIEDTEGQTILRKESMMNRSLTALSECPSGSTRSRKGES